jgi:outer membrane protein assembly factor BamB
VAVVVLALGSWGTVEGVRWWSGRCEAMVGPVPAGQKLPSSIHPVKPTEVNLDPLVEARRVFAQDVLAQAGRTPSLGTLRSVAVAGDEETLVPRDARQVAGVADGAPLLLFEERELHGKQVNAGVLTRLAGDADGTGWARWYDGHELEAAQTPQGLVLAQLPSDKVPQVTSVDRSSGELHWCIPVGGEHATAAVAAGDSGLFVLSGTDYDEDDQQPVLISLDPANGKTRWKTQVDGFENRGTVDVFGDSVLVTQWGIKTENFFDWPQVNNDGGVETDGGSLRAFRADNGQATWEYSGPDDSGWAISVVGVHDFTAVVLARRTPVPDHTWDREDQNWMIGLGPDGKERWRQDLGNKIKGYARSGVTMAGDVVLRFEDKGGSGASQTVVARDVSTGKVRWTETVDGDHRFRPERLAVADGNLLIARSHDLVSVDLTSGVLRSLLTDNGLDAELDVKVDDRAIVAQAAGLILNFERRPR